MSLLWKTAMAFDPEGHSITSETHNDHLLAKEFRDAGMKQSPCTAKWCNAYDKSHADAQDRAEGKVLFKRDREAAWTDHDLDLKKPVYGMEASANPVTLENYQKNPGSRRSEGSGQAWAFRHRGKIHLQNGHHGVAAAMLRGDSHYPIKLVDLDKEG